MGSRSAKRGAFLGLRSSSFSQSGAPGIGGRSTTGERGGEGACGVGERGGEGGCGVGDGGAYWGRGGDSAGGGGDSAGGRSNDCSGGRSSARYLAITVRGIPSRAPLGPGVVVNDA